MPIIIKGQWYLLLLALDGCQSIRSGKLQVRNMKTINKKLQILNISLSRYRICIEDPAPNNSRDPNYRIGSSPTIDKSILLVNYMATPVSLLMSAEDIQEQNLCLKLTDDQVGRLLTANGPNCDSTCTKVYTYFYHQLYR